MEISAASLRRLSDWADTFRSGVSAGRWQGGNADSAGVIQMPWYELSPEFERFVREMSEADFVRPIAWVDWAKSAAAQRLIADPAAIADATSDELIYLVTTIIRGERFSDGQIEAAYQRGTLLAIAERSGVILASRASDP